MSEPPEFPYHRIVDELRAAIRAGELAPGERVSSEWSLAQRYGTSRPTVRRAIAVLKAEGLVTTRQGQGSFVRSVPHVRLRLTGSDFRRHREAGQTGFDAQVREQGQRPRQRLLDVTTEAPPEDVADRLGAGTAVVRRRLFLVDDVPVARCDSYYPAAWASGTALTEPRRLPGGALAVVEDPAGSIRRQVARSVDELTARMPTPAEAEQLALAPGTPVVRVLRTVYDSDDKPVEVQESVAAADRHEFRYEVDLR